jgi:hypothetical protein
MYDIGLLESREDGRDGVYVKRGDKNRLKQDTVTVSSLPDEDGKVLAEDAGQIRRLFVAIHRDRCNGNKVQVLGLYVLKCCNSE